MDSSALFTTTAAQDLADLVMGERLGNGIHRTVFVLRPDPTCVIKVERELGQFANVMEWKNWEMLRYTIAGKFLAPCRVISNHGDMLIQERTYPVPKHYKWPAMMPSVLTDLKYQNFGLSKDGKLWCHDYATVVDMPRDRMRKAKWWDADD
jgi:hypothetical protein